MLKSSQTGGSSLAKQHRNHKVSQTSHEAGKEKYHADLCEQE